MASVLLTVGELALVAGPSLRPHIGDLLPLIIDAVQDPADSHKRNVAVVTLGNVRCYLDCIITALSCIHNCACGGTLCFVVEFVGRRPCAASGTTHWA